MKKAQKVNPTIQKLGRINIIDRYLPRRKFPRLDRKEVRKIVSFVAFTEGFTNNINIVVVDNNTIRKLKKKFFNIDEVTDVIAFNYGDKNVVGEELNYDEVVVSIEKAREEAKIRRIDFKKELALYIIHGLLHLCGYDDLEISKRKKMCRREIFFLKKLGY